MRVVPDDVWSSSSGGRSGRSGAEGSVPGRERRPVPAEGVDDGPDTIDGADADEGDDDPTDTADPADVEERSDGEGDDGSDPVDDVGEETTPDGRADAIRCEDGAPADGMREELGELREVGAGGPAVPASMLATRRARTSRVFFATSATIAAISGARAMVVAPSIAPASCRAV
jgi:hypothetical protein